MDLRSAWHCEDIRFTVPGGGPVGHIELEEASDWSCCSTWSREKHMRRSRTFISGTAGLIQAALVTSKHLWTGSHRDGHSRWCFLREAAAALAGSITLATAACTSSATHIGTANGTALVRGFGGYLGLAPLKPGAELGLLIVGLHNRSRSPIAISSVTLVGQGVGTVIKALEIKIAPATTGNNSAPGGAYEVSPPAAYWGATGSCTRQPLVPLRGFRLAPRALARVWVVIQAARPGQFHVRAHLVRYRQHGISYQQLIPTGYKGSVSTNARFIPIDKQQARCMKSEHVRPLIPVTRSDPERPGQVLL